MFQVAAPYPLMTTTLILPSPKFSNQKNKAMTLTSARAMDGTLYTYIKKKRGRQVYLYDFLTSYHKSLESKLFTNQFSDQLVRVIDHEDKLIIGYITLNPIEFVGEGRAGGWPGNEAYSFQLQLEERV